ncbi:DUF2780 domain-containing protein [Rhabdaerophilum sp. SD176]|uniref:DUF2780 domain-containing protein n=1 Tax=Rhabdaerophilum sp. SD176 TaxID=2983548 RepID=UPI0024E03E9F|nr:DUF2780 domain-containing protein [Rhabdaerophilum sp. SD176]
MDELINRVATNVGLEPAMAQQAVGMILSFLQKNGPAEEISQMMAAMPGAAELAAANSGESGGLMGGLMNMMGQGGGVMALGQQLMSAGIGMGQITALSKEVFAYGQEKAGEDTMGAIVGAIPGLSQFV